MTQEDFEFLTILKEKWDATRRTGSRSVITSEDVAKTNEIHLSIFGSPIKPCSACFMDSVHSLIILRDQYEEANQQIESGELIDKENEKPTRQRKRNQKESE